MRDTIKHRSAYSGLIGIFVDRPLLNIILVFTGVLYLTITGFGPRLAAQPSFDRSANLFLIIQLCQLSIGLVGAIGLPFLWCMMAVGTARKKLVTAFSVGLFIILFITLPVIFAGLFGLEVGGQAGLEIGGQSGWQSPIASSLKVFSLRFNILFVVTSLASLLIIIGMRFSPIPSKITLIMAAILCGVSFAMVGGFLKMNVALLGAAIPLSIYGIISGGITALLIGYFYEMDFGQFLKPRQAAYTSASKIIPFCLIFFFLAGGVLFLLPSLQVGAEDLSETLLVNSLSWRQKILIALLAGGLPSISILMTLPGLLWFYATRSKEQEKRNLSEKATYRFDPAEINQDYILKGIAAENLWKSIRRFLPPPTAYALFFIVAILCIVAVLMNEVQAGYELLLFLIVVVLGASFAFLSLRASLVIGSVMSMVMILTSAFLSLIAPNQIFTYELMIVNGLSVLTCSLFAVYFRDISATTQYPKMVISQVMTKSMGPFFMVTGFGSGFIALSGFCGLWGNAHLMALAYALSNILILTLSPTVMTILSARYGKF